MTVEIKFCGMTRPADIAAAVAAGAHYVGVIFAGGPRTVTVERARELFQSVPSESLWRVGVFAGGADHRDIASTALAAGADVVQLHGDPGCDAVERVRASFGGSVWAALRVRDGVVPDDAIDLFRVADAVVLDTYSPSSLGGTGEPLPWDALASRLDEARQAGRLILAGGLRPETVGTAIRILRPDVVDVSSGVESAPGIKDHAKLRAFCEAVEREGNPR